MPSIDTKDSLHTLPRGLVKFAKDCTAGTIGGIAVVGVGHPFGEFRLILSDGLGGRLIIILLIIIV